MQIANSTGVIPIGNQPNTLRKAPRLAVFTPDMAPPMRGEVPTTAPAYSLGPGVGSTAHVTKPAALSALYVV